MPRSNAGIRMSPIGWVRCAETVVPRYCSISRVEGQLVIEPSLAPGLRNVRAGDRVVVLFHFHRSPPFTPRALVLKPPQRSKRRGVFSTCSPVRPNPIGMSVVTVVRRRDNVIDVVGLDMHDGTPILDLKPYKDPLGRPTR